MSTFGGKLPNFKDISIDRFDGDNIKSGAFFLSHCHTDHMVGLRELYENVFVHRPHLKLYTSKVSAVILNNLIPNLGPYIKPLSIQDPTLVKIHLKNESQQNNVFISVTLIPAGHCPGSVMFVFEDLNNYKSLYTGDFRIAPTALPKIKQFHESDGTVVKFDQIHFDSTFWGETYNFFPDRNKSRDQLCELISRWIKKGKDHVVFLNTSARYGYEFLYIEIFKKLKMPVLVSQSSHDVYSCIPDMNGAVTVDPNKSQIHSCKDINRHSKIKLRTIRISALKWRSLTDGDSVYSKEPQKESFSVCYSSHCSFDELKGFIDYFRPKSLYPNVVPEQDADAFMKSIHDYFVISKLSDNTSNSIVSNVETIKNTATLKSCKRNSIETIESSETKCSNLIEIIKKSSVCQNSYQLNKKIKLFQ